MAMPLGITDELEGLIKDVRGAVNRVAASHSPSFNFNAVQFAKLIAEELGYHGAVRLFYPELPRTLRNSALTAARLETYLRDNREQLQTVGRTAAHNFGQAMRSAVTLRDSLQQVADLVEGLEPTQQNEPSPQYGEQIEDVTDDVARSQEFVDAKAQLAKAYQLVKGVRSRIRSHIDSGVPLHATLIEELDAALNIIRTWSGDE